MHSRYLSQAFTDAPSQVSQGGCSLLLEICNPYWKLAVKTFVPHCPLALRTFGKCGNVHATKKRNSLILTLKQGQPKWRIKKKKAQTHKIIAIISLTLGLLHLH